MINLLSWYLLKKIYSMITGDTTTILQKIAVLHIIAIFVWESQSVC